MESAKTALGLTRYFISLPPARHLVGLLLLGVLAGGALLGVASAGAMDGWAILKGAGTALIVVGLPSLLCAMLVSLLRRRVPLPRALALATLSAAIYLIFDVSAVMLRPLHPLSANLIFVGFGFAFLAWFCILKFAFGLSRSAWLFSTAQLLVYALFLLAGSTLYAGGVPDVLGKTALAAAVFVGALYGILFVASGPMKRNLGVSSPDALSMFASQWLYGETDLEEALDEMGESARTLVGVATFVTRRGSLHWVVPYLHFGPFGNLGGSQFSWQLSQGLLSPQHDSFVFHGTATHDLDPVSSSQLGAVLSACQKAIAQCRPKSARFLLRTGRSGDSRCYRLSINDSALLSFSRAPLSTEDVNFAIGCALMERACRPAASGRGRPPRDALAIDCHNAETGDVDYVEAGSPISWDMSDALDDAMRQTGKPAPLKAGWASRFPQDVSGVGSNGIRVTCFAGPDRAPAFFVLIDSNGIIASARGNLMAAIRRKMPRTAFCEVLTTDTHQLNTIRGVFNPAGEEDYDALERSVMECAIEALARLEPAAFDMKKVRLDVKVLGPYQSAEIVSTLNSVWSVLRILAPLGMLIAIGLVLWLVGKV